MSFDKLERNLIDIIKEEQAKLGFFEEDIRLYYPLSSLNHFFDSTDNAGEMQERLEHFPEGFTDRLGYSQGRPFLFSYSTERYGLCS